MISETQEWNNNVWRLHIFEEKLKRAFEDGSISKSKNKKIKKIISESWIKIWDFHPDQPPLTKELFKLHFG